jgi:L-alanine-DL-glutamate epimerase-like enolase superfamily enzyme
MGDVLLVQANAKSAIDLACWDILGKSVDGPIAALLGGVLNADFPLYEAVLLKSPEEVVDFVREQGVAGIKRFQLKVGNDPFEDAARTRCVIETVPKGHWWRSAIRALCAKSPAST